MTGTDNAAGAACGEGTCEDALDRLELYLDGELADDQLDEVRAHLSACFPCADAATFEEQLRALIRDRCSEATPPDLKLAIRRRLDSMDTSSA